MSRRYPDWNIDGRDWPNRDASSFVQTNDYNWHVQQMGEGPVCLLLHGTGAATHSWREVMPLLAEHYRVIAMDLPGHGFTRPNLRRAVSLEGMSHSISALLGELDAEPALIVGHSAGVAIGAQLLLDNGWKTPLVGFAPALMPFPGLAARIFPQLAKMLFTNPLVSFIFARLARYPGETAKFLKRATGSKIGAEGEKYYERLFSRPGHCDGAIRMMANWRLEDLQERLPRIDAPVLLIHAANDSAIPESAVRKAAALIPGCETLDMEKLGHLAHEEDPGQAVHIIRKFAKTHLKA